MSVETTWCRSYQGTEEV